MYDFKKLTGELAYWEEKDIWETVGNITEITMDIKEICSRSGSEKGILMLLPSHLDWYESRDLCRRFGGRLHVD